MGAERATCSVCPHGAPRTALPARTFCSRCSGSGTRTLSWAFATSEPASSSLRPKAELSLWETTATRADIAANAGAGQARAGQG